MAYYYYNYYANVGGYTLVSINFPAETSSWSDGETFNIGSPAGTPGVFRLSSTLFSDNQPATTMISDIAPTTSGAFPRTHPTLGAGVWTGDTQHGRAFGLYGVADSPALSGQNRDKVPVNKQFLVLNSNLTSSLTVGTKIYNVNHLLSSGEAINLTSSWRIIPKTTITGSGIGNAFCSVTSSDGSKLIVYGFGGDVSYSSNPLGLTQNYVFVCTASTSNAGLKLNISPWYHMDENKSLWPGTDTSVGFNGSTGATQAGISPMTIPISVGIRDGAACVDKASTTVYFGGGSRPLYVGSDDYIFGWNKIFGWHYDQTSGMLSGSPFLAGEMPMGRSAHEMFVANGFLYCAGGYTGSYNADTWGSSAANVTCSTHNHIDRAIINFDGMLTNWAMCKYEMPAGYDVSGSGAGSVDGATFIFPDNAVSTDKRFVYLVAGLKAWDNNGEPRWGASSQVYTAELDFTGSAAYLPNKNKIGVDPSWMGPSAGETLTVGPSMGPNDIRPVLPLLDDIYQQLVVPTSPDSQLPESSKQLVGFRPGLRGTEIFGDWKLRFSNNPGIFNPNGTADTVSYSSLTSSQYHVRQVRIEFLVDATAGTSDIQYFNPARERLYKRSSRGFKNGKKLVDIISGSYWWDAGVSYIYAYQQSEYGRTVGLTVDGSGSDYAVWTQLTGALAAHLTGTPSWFLNPPPGEGVSGLPYIPLSSATFGEASVPLQNTGTAAGMIAATVDQQLPVPADNTLPAYLSRIRAIRTTQQRFEEELINSVTGSYF